MKRAVVILIANFGLLSFAASQSVIDKTAVLWIPDVVSMQDRLTANVEFRWDGKRPLSLDTWLIDGKLSTYGDIRCFDESGKEVPMVFPMSMPLIPSGKKEFQKDDLVKMGLYYMGSIQFPRTGNYYATAVFSSAVTGNTNVRFTTAKRWFRVVQAALKKINA